MSSHGPAGEVRIFVLSTLLLVSVVPGRGRAQVARMEVHPFASTTPTDQQFLTGQTDGKAVELAGELRIPAAGTDRLPAVVLLHPSGGISGFVSDWAQRMNALGVATFVIDSFTGRGLSSVINDQAQLGRLTMIVDAYRALDLLVRHPRIDRERIALMGFSRGGHAALYASLKRFQRMHGSAGTGFAAYISFYPDCSTTYLDDVDVAGRPVRIFHGGADDYSPVAPCRAYVERLRRAGKDVQLAEYPGANHLFDASTIKTPLKLSQAQTLRGCRLEELADGRIVNSTTKEAFTYADACVERGTTIGYDAAASAEAERAVRELATAVLKPK